MPFNFLAIQFLSIGTSRWYWKPYHHNLINLNYQLSCPILAIFFIKALFSPFFGFHNSSSWCYLVLSTITLLHRCPKLILVKTYLLCTAWSSVPKLVSRLDQAPCVQFGCNSTLGHQSSLTSMLPEPRLQHMPIRIGSPGNLSVVKNKRDISWLEMYLVNKNA